MSSPLFLLPDATRAYLSHPSLEMLWAAARKRLEGNRLSPTGTVQVLLDWEGAERLQGILGRPVEPGLRRVSLAALETALRSSSAACGLVSAVADLTGHPLRDRAAASAAHSAQWTAMWQKVDEQLSKEGLADEPWIALWLQGIRSAGVLTRVGAEAAARAMAGCVRALSALRQNLDPASGDFFSGRPWELAELAAYATGDAHGLDEGRLTGALVLRAVATAFSEPHAQSSASRRLLWERAGVSVDSVSGTVLVWKLEPPGTHPWSVMMRSRSALSLVTHLTLQELRAISDLPLTAAGATVYACENPQVLQAAARYNVSYPLVCVSGNPSGAGIALLQRLSADGADIAYHGDFDWAGVSITNRLIEAGARPWRMSSDDYLQACGASSPENVTALTGTPIRAVWDADLEHVMQRQGIAIHEESQLLLLLTDLRRE